MRVVAVLNLLYHLFALSIVLFCNPGEESVSFSFRKHYFMYTKYIFAHLYYMWARVWRIICLSVHRHSHAIFSLARPDS